MTVPQVQAQTDEQRRQQELMQQQQQRAAELTRQLEQATADFSAGKITMAEYQRKVTEIQNEIAKMNSQAQTAQQQAAQSGASFSQAQLQRIEALLDQNNNLEAQYNDRRITEADYTRQMTALRNELNQITAPFKGSPSAAIQYAGVEERVKKLWPRAKPGWPYGQGQNRFIEAFEYGPFTQSRGTRASYSIVSNFVGDVVYDLFITQTGGQPDVVFREMKNQIERIFSGKVIKVNVNNANNYDIDVSWSGTVPDKDGFYTVLEVGVAKDNEGVHFTITIITENINDPRKRSKAGE